MALPKGKTLESMRKLRSRVQEEEKEEEPVIENDDGTISGEVYGARLESLLKEVDVNFELEPEAQELVLRMTEDFVNRVTRRAAAYAKHRKSSTLDAVDLQLCLEKHWNINVPGLPSQRAKAAFAYRRPTEKKAPPGKKRKTTTTTPAAAPAF
ncbi:hypothetical protein CTAYLR_000532 [Chrysophaeum taylorii]|uniref:Transcription initiation factor TFIID subunit 12 domain-containing protein n=1 Tax=Chrysophaeum taylorii TaxID=2483200 RepID=A0AAD7UGX5_9STRA|nr:hypothetical protein CTAYLR_000532 [Chrysophaeum taylorii]